MVLTGTGSGQPRQLSQYRLQRATQMPRQPHCQCNPMGLMPGLFECVLVQRCITVSCGSREQERQAAQQLPYQYLVGT